MQSLITRTTNVLVTKVTIFKKKFSVKKKGKPKVEFMKILMGFFALFFHPDGGKVQKCFFLLIMVLDR